MAKIKKIKLDVTQTQFLYEHLRGTGRSITAKEAKSVYGIQQLPARMSELRGLGLKVNTARHGKEMKYSISSRDLWGSRAKIAV